MLDKTIEDIVNVLLPEMGVAVDPLLREKRITDRDTLRWALRALVNIAADKGRGQIQ